MCLLSLEEIPLSEIVVRRDENLFLEYLQPPEPDISKTTRLEYVYIQILELSLLRFDV